jgi:hypothetical protein
MLSGRGIVITNSLPWGSILMKMALTDFFGYFEGSNFKKKWIFSGVVLISSFTTSY